MTGMTRSAFLTRGALATAGTLGTAAVGPWVAGALAEAQSIRDTDIVNFALNLEHLEADYYGQALKKVGDLSGETRRIVSTVHESERFHVSVLLDLLKQLGAAPDRVPSFDFGRAFASEASFLALAQTLEDTGVGAYNGAAPQLQDPHVLDMAGRVVQVEARHAAMIRFLRDQDIAPAAFDRPFTRKQTLVRTGLYIRH